MTILEAIKCLKQNVHVAHMVKLQGMPCAGHKYISFLVNHKGMHYTNMCNIQRKGTFLTTLNNIKWI